MADYLGEFEQLVLLALICREDGRTMPAGPPGLSDPDHSQQAAKNRRQTNTASAVSLAPHQNFPVFSVTYSPG
jgi:hypothetical protein